MRKLPTTVWVLLVVVLLGACNGDGDSSSKPRAKLPGVLGPAPEGPSLAYDPQVLELGTVAENARMTDYVDLRNRGRKQLVIEKIVTTCRCIETNLGKKTLAPNETTMLEVTFDAAGYSGNMEQHAWIVTNDAEEPSRDLMIRAYVKTSEN